MACWRYVAESVQVGDVDEVVIGLPARKSEHLKVGHCGSCENHSKEHINNGVRIRENHRPLSGKATHCGCEVRTSQHRRSRKV